MPSQKRRKLESTVSALQQRYGPQAVRKATDIKFTTPPAISSGFPAFDALTGCKGIPLNTPSLLSGPPTSGKLTVAYKTLTNAQQKDGSVMVLDLHQSTDPDYLAHCGIDLATLYIARPTPEQTVPLLLDLVRTRKLRVILIDSLADILLVPASSRMIRTALEQLMNLLRGSGCALCLSISITRRGHTPSNPRQQGMPFEQGSAMSKAWANRHGRLLHNSAPLPIWLISATVLI